MRTSLSAALRAKSLLAECGVVIVNLLELTHSLFGTIRLCDRNEDFESAGELFTAWTFVGGLNDEVENEVPNPVLIFDATDQAILQAIQTALDGDIREKVRIKHWFVTEDEPDYNQLPRKVPYYVTAFDLEQDDEGEVLSVSIEFAAITNTSWQAHGFVEQYFRALFAGGAAA